MFFDIMCFSTLVLFDRSQTVVCVEAKVHLFLCIFYSYLFVLYVPRGTSCGLTSWSVPCFISS